MISLLGHGVALALFVTATPPLGSLGQAPPALEVEIVPTPIPEPELVPVPVPSPEVAPPKPAPRIRKPPVARKSQPAPTPQAPNDPESAKENEAPVSLPSPPPSFGETRGVSDDDLRAYAQLVWERIARTKPRDVRSSGTAVIRLTISLSGALLLAEVVTSSGSDTLDQLAIETVAQAAPFPPPPAGTREGQLSFTVPFQFR